MYPLQLQKLVIAETFLERGHDHGKIFHILPSFLL